MGFCFLLVVVIICAVIHGSVILDLLSRTSIIKNTCIAVIVFSVLIALMVSYHRLTTLLQKYHESRFKDIKKSLRFFFIFETFGLFPTFTCHLLMYIHKQNSNVFSGIFMSYIENINFWIWAYYPIFQAYGLVKFKDSSDPLQGISLLNMMIIVSHN